MPDLGRRVKGYKLYWKEQGKVSLPFSLGRGLRAVFHLSYPPPPSPELVFSVWQNLILSTLGWFPCLKKPPAFGLPAAACLAPSLRFIPSGLLCSIWGGVSSPLLQLPFPHVPRGLPSLFPCLFPASPHPHSVPPCLPRTPADGPPPTTSLPGILLPFLLFFNPPPPAPFLTLHGSRLPCLLPLTTGLSLSWGGGIPSARLLVGHKRTSRLTCLSTFS